MSHVPVLLKEVLSFVDPKPGEFIIDGTVNGGGHTEEILKRMMPEGKYLAIDLDESLIEKTKLRIESQFKIPNKKFLIFWKNGNYADIPKFLEDEDLGRADKLLLDLGFSSFQMDDSKRGFSFSKNEKLDMRYDIKEKFSAYEAVNVLKEEELAEIFWKFGEEKFSRKIARSIVLERKGKPIVTTSELAEIVKKSLPRKYSYGRIHPATKVFQALRIYVNGELENLERLLSNLHLILKPGGMAVIISFHSLEDRMVKNHFRSMKNEKKAELITKKPVKTSEEEIIKNPRSRSAKIRAIKLI